MLVGVQRIFFVSEERKSNDIKALEPDEHFLKFTNHLSIEVSCHDKMWKRAREVGCLIKKQKTAKKGKLSSPIFPSHVGKNTPFSNRDIDWVV
jgi:hypothetical protein